MKDKRKMTFDTLHFDKIANNRDINELTRYISVI